MISLKDSWQEQRKQRHQEIVQRQQHVRNMLDTFQHDRHTKASALREDLRLFQLKLQLETYDFLAQTGSDRRVQAEELARHLQNVAQTLREQTAQMMVATAAERSIMAQQLVQDLGEFHANLITSVTSLRIGLQQNMQHLRHEVQRLQSDVQLSLQIYQQDRIHKQIQHMHDLAEWVETLRSSMQNYLVELELMRHDRAQQVQTMLEADRDRRITEVHDLFQDLAAFRAELNTYCIQMRQSVWGGNVSSQPAQTVREQQQGSLRQGMISKPPVPQRSTVPATFGSGKSSPAKPVSAKPVSVKSSSAKPNSVKSNSVKSVSAKSQPQPLIAESQSVPASEPIAPTISSSSFSSSRSTESSVEVTKNDRDAAHIEKEVYHHIYHTQGARLTELESALNLNRFQTVDALRSLIKKGLVTQRDRMYLIQEDVSL